MLPEPACHYGRLTLAAEGAAGETDTAIKKPSFIAVSVVASAAALVLAGCGADGPSLAQQFACNTMSTVGQKPISWNGIVLVTVPAEFRGDSGYPYQGDISPWEQLLRQRNHYAGIGTAVVKASSSVVIPRRCSSGEKPGSAPTATFGG